MRNRRSILPALVGGMVLATMGALPALAQKGGGDIEPARLSLAVADSEGRQSEPAVTHLVARVAELSDGKMTIEPVYGAGDLADYAFEEGVADLVKSGDYDLGMAATRAWDLDCAAGCTGAGSYGGWASRGKWPRCVTPLWPPCAGAFRLACRQRPS